ncbi:MAG: hypothetical protein HY720_05540 [Planctomycetes bacterium]|nr:hypothetical protein [Planctomycetota bacterium]
MSSIDSLLTPNELRVLGIYRDRARCGMGRAVRLSLQYATGTGIFLALAIVTGNPLWSIVVYGTFLAWMPVRLLVGRRLAGILPSVIEKYEARIAELEMNLARQERSRS